MERRRRTAVATFFAAADVAPGSTIALPDDAAQHARVRRMQAGDEVRLTNGRGVIGEGILERLTKNAGDVAVERVNTVSQPPHLRLFVPVADRERMLWLAEKSTDPPSADHASPSSPLKSFASTLRWRARSTTSTPPRSSYGKRVA